MKKYLRIGIALAVAALLLVPTGCSTTSSSGQKTYDPIKTEQVQKAIIPNLASAVLLTIKKEPKVYPGIVLAQSVIADLSSRKVADPTVVNEALLGLDIKFLANEDAKIGTQLAINSLLGIYNAAVAADVRQGVAKDQYVLAILTTVSDGLAQGLKQAKDAGLVK